MKKPMFVLVSLVLAAAGDPEARAQIITKTGNPDYSYKSLQAAVRCFDWCIKTAKEVNTEVIGASIQAANEMFKTTKQDSYANFAVKQAALLKDLQAINQSGEGVSGFFYTSPSDKKPFKDIWQKYLIQNKYEIFELVIG
jgi:hypothetical protein